MKRTLAKLSLVLSIAVISPITSNCQSSVEEIGKMVTGLSKIGDACSGKFVAEEKRRTPDDAWYEVRYVLKGKVMYSQNIEADELSGYQSNGCNGLFVKYWTGPSGQRHKLQEPYLIYPSAGKFSYFDFSENSMGIIRVQYESTSPQESTIIAEKGVDGVVPPCDQYAFWGRVFNLNASTGGLIEIKRGEIHRKYYASLASHLRSTYDHFKSRMTANCVRRALQLIKESDTLAKRR